jgi:hypothetical protein
MLVAGPAAGAIGGYTKNATYEGIKAAGGGYSITPAALNKDVGTNALFGVIPGLADLPSVGRALGLAGRDSLSSLAKALVNKLDRGIISNVSAASTLKMVFYSAFQQVLGSSAQSTIIQCHPLQTLRKRHLIRLFRRPQAAAMVRLELPIRLFMRQIRFPLAALFVAEVCPTFQLHGALKPLLHAALLRLLFLFQISQSESFPLYGCDLRTTR